MQIEPITRQQLSAQVLEKLRHLIESGEYPVGSRFPTEPRLMKALGVGRSTVREAVQSLAHGGVLEVRQGSGTFVRALPSDTESLQSSLRRSEVAEVQEARLALEQDIAYFAALRRTPQQLERIRAALRRRAKAKTSDKNIAELAEADLEFHMSVAQACGNAVLVDLYRSFSTVVRESILYQVREVGSDEIQAEHHEELLQAIEAGDGARARDAVKTLLERASTILRQR